MWKTSSTLRCKSVAQAIGTEGLKPDYADMRYVLSRLSPESHFFRHPALPSPIFNFIAKSV